MSFKSYITVVMIRFKGVGNGGYAGDLTPQQFMWGILICICPGEAGTGLTNSTFIVLLDSVKMVHRRRRPSLVQISASGVDLSVDESRITADDAFTSVEESHQSRSPDVAP